MVTTHALPEPVLRECGLRKYRHFPAEQAEPLCVTRTDWGQGLLDGFILASNMEGRLTCKSIYLSICLSIYLSIYIHCHRHTQYASVFNIHHTQHIII